MVKEIPPELSAVSRETLERLQLLEHLVAKWNPAINLVSKPSMADFWERHVVDSLQLFRLAEADSLSWCDLGSGGGFPGLVIASVAKDTGSPTHVTLVESDRRKCVFLREAARQMDLQVTVVNERIEDMPPARATVVSARALAPLPKLCEFAFRHMAEIGQCLFPKGSKHLEELEEARRFWTFDLATHQSTTDPSASIIVLRNLHHA